MEMVMAKASLKVYINSGILGNIERKYLLETTNRDSPGSEVG